MERQDVSCSPQNHMRNKITATLIQELTTVEIWNGTVSYRFKHALKLFLFGHCFYSID
jgi:hypothetical protein